MNFIEYFKSIDNKRTKQEVRTKIVEATGIHVITFYSWLRRGAIPKTYHNVICSIVGMPKTELFPETN